MPRNVPSLMFGGDVALSHGWFQPVRLEFVLTELRAKTAQILAALKLDNECAFQLWFR